MTGSGDASGGDEQEAQASAASGAVATPGRWAIGLAIACLAQVGGAALGVGTESGTPHLFGVLIGGAALAWAVILARPDARFYQEEPRPSRVFLSLGLGFALWLAFGWAAGDWLLPDGQAFSGGPQEQMADLNASAPGFVSVAWLSILGALWAHPLSRWLLPPRLEGR
jgi:hypothetical protein